MLWPISISEHRALAQAGLVPSVAGAVVWRFRGQLNVTAIVKTTLTLEPDGPMLPAASLEAIHEEEVYASPSRTIRWPSDLAPFQQKADVLLIGHAHAPAGQLATLVRARLAVGRAEVGALLDKSIEVRGDRGALGPRPFQKMPLIYERAFGGIGFLENPFGSGADPGSEPPNLYNPREPLVPACFAPISRLWQARKRLLHGFDAHALAGKSLSLPSDFDWGYFQSAPPDQQIPYLVGDEWILLEGVHPVLPRLLTRLPGLRAHGQVLGLLGPEDVQPHAIRFQADTLVVDADAARCTITWRATFPVHEEAWLTSLRVLTVVEGDEVSGEDRPASTVELVPAPVPLEAAGDVGDAVREHFGTGTYTLSSEESASAAERPATPFYSITVQTLTELPSLLPAPALPVDAPQAVMEVPPRTSEAIPIVHATGLSVATMAWQVRPPKDTLTVIVKGVFDIVDGAPARLREGKALLSGDLHWDDDPHRSVRYPSDYAIFKVKADVVLLGHGYAPGREAPASQVSLKLGHPENQVSRKLVAIGERVWEKALVGSTPTAPRPFEKIPLVYEHAFGGPGYERNPLGRGYKTEALPCLEDPSALLTSPNDMRAPACFAPIPIQWKERWSKLGTYDAKWRKARWPYFPEDFDWSYFQAAPQSQQLAYLHGDEPFELAGVHPTKAVIKGSLPGLRVRCFSQQTKEAGGRFQEIALNLDTAVLESDSMTLSLVWRGIVEVSEEDAPEIQCLFLLQESLRDPAVTLAEAHDLLLRACLPLSPAVEVPEAPPVGNDVPSEEDAEEPGVLRDVRAQVEAAERERAEKLKALGLSLEQVQQVQPAEKALHEMSAEDALAQLQASKMRPEDLDTLRQVLTPDPEEPAEPTLRDRVIAMRIAGERMDEMDLASADLSGLDLSGCSFARANLKDVSFKDAVLREADFSGAQLGGADLCGASLERASLVGADLHGARLAGACLKGAKLGGASFLGARGENASFEGASGERILFTEGIWEGASFEAAELPQADFIGARVCKAVFKGSKLLRARFFKASGEGAVFDGAILTGSAFEEADLAHSSFLGVSAEDTSFDKATLTSTLFERANLRRATFVRASGLKATFTGADLREGCLRRAKLSGAVFVKADLMLALLERADLSLADLRSANLHACETWRAKMEHAKLDGALITQTKLKEQR